MTGVMPIVKGTLTGSRALVHRNATAKELPLLVTAFASQDLSSGFASALRSFSAQQKPLLYLKLALSKFMVRLIAEVTVANQ